MNVTRAHGDKNAVAAGLLGSTGSLAPATGNEVHMGQMRLFLEEIFCEATRFRHIEETGLGAEDIRIYREVSLGAPGCYADLLVKIPDIRSYYVELKFGYTEENLLGSICRKYAGENVTLDPDVDTVLLIARESDYNDWPGLKKQLQDALPKGLKLEAWTQAEFYKLFKERFGVEINASNEDSVLDLRVAIDKAKWLFAYGEEYADNPFGQALLWHFSSWYLQRLCRDEHLRPRDVLAPKVYPSVVIIMADLCSFSSYVRDSRDDDVARTCLATFYSKARHAIHNAGGMLYQFVGDEVVGLFGLHDTGDHKITRVLDCANALRQIGTSVSQQWQREIDRVQNSQGVHIGISIGDLSLVRFRPFSRTHVGFIGDSLNLSARLMGEAGSNEVVVSNTFYRRLTSQRAALFEAMGPVTAKNMGDISCWRWPSE
ncbi:MAG: adenylate/guanylate cyclase domain-containing protein [Proteobacteria bacterium]|nr:adenylate/guanylate cyclase domain-containing protein [Pseudomonadota bacterium]